MKIQTLTRTIALLAALTCAKEVRAQGDLDILLRTVPPVVMIQFDTSGSMRQIVLPEKYRTDRGAGVPSVWFHWPNNDNTTRPAAFKDVSTTPNNWEDSGTGTGTTTENYERTCQIFPNNTNNALASAICMPTLSPASQPACSDDENFGSQLASGHVIKCWGLPGGCTNVPAGLSCNTSPRARRREGGTTVSQQYTTITTQDLSFTSTTLYPPNYLFWLVNEIYRGNTPVAFDTQDRLAAAKEAVTALINQMNVDGQNPKVKFGLARYDGASSVGGYVVVPASTTNKVALLAQINNPDTGTPAGLPANGSTPLSETLVDVGRYLAGSTTLGTGARTSLLPAVVTSATPYAMYNRNLTTGAATGSPPASPVNSECEKIFIIVVTDGLPTSDDHSHATTAFNATIYSAYGDGDGDYTDDVAAMLLDTDLRPGVPGIQNAVTYTVGFSLDSPLLEHAATRGDGQYYSANDSIGLANALTFAVNDILLRNTTLTAANVPANRTAFGDGFYTAYFSPGGQRSLWPGHLQAFRVNEALDVVDAADQLAIDPLTDLFYEPRNPFWDLSDTLISDYASRTIYTTKAGVRAPFTPAGITATDLGVALSEEMQYPQDPNDPDFTTAEELADAIVSFMHGYDSFDENDDGSLVDVREFVLGDIFHSNPLAVGAPLQYLRFETGYGPASDATSFLGTHGNRDRVLYAGANDGMLHAAAAGSFYDPNTSVSGDESYTAGDGHELFGYVPGALLPKVKLLPKLQTGKQYFVDGQASAADVWIDYDLDGIKEGSDWTSVLLTPLREGGESVLALDVTDPAATGGNHFPYPRLMWEFTHANLGQTWSKPIVTRVKMRAGMAVGDRCGVDNGDGDCVEEWVAIFGAGYRPQGDPNLSAYTNDPNNPTYTKKGRGVYMVRVSDGAILSSIAQDPNSATYSKMRFAIPAEPAVLDLNFDGFADVVYIGDLGGQLWKWDISLVGVPVAGVVPNTNWPAGVVFESPVATTAGGVLHYHSIFQSAAAAFNQGDLWLTFASGERANLGYIGEADPNNPTSLVGKYDDNNRMWVLKDRTPTGTGAFPATLPIYEEPLLPATVPLPGHGSLTDVTNFALDPNDLDEGYFFRVADGVKFMTNHLIFGGFVYTASYAPTAGITPPPGSCALGGTTAAWGFELDDAGGGLDDPAVPGTLIRSVTIGNGAPTDPRITVGPDGVKITLQTSTGQVLNPGAPIGMDLVDMIYWRQNF